MAVTVPSSRSILESLFRLAKNDASEMPREWLNLPVWWVISRVGSDAIITWTTNRGPWASSHILGGVLVSVYAAVDCYEPARLHFNQGSLRPNTDATRAFEVFEEGSLHVLALNASSGVIEADRE
jgi:hypothetical protein